MTRTAPGRVRRRRRRAFTLLELILALSMVAILALTLYVSMSIVSRAKQSAFGAIAPVRSALLAADLVRQDLESVLPPTQLLAGPFIGTSQGGADMLDFFCLGADAGWNVGRMSTNNQNGLGGGGGGLGGLRQQQQQPIDQDPPWSEGPRHVVLWLNTDVNPPMLVRSVTRNLLAPVTPEPEDEILARNVKSLTMRYFDGTDWQDEWDSTTLGNVLPYAVEMTIEAYVDAPRPGDPPSIYKVTRVFPMACAKPATDASGTGGAAPAGTGGGQ